MRKDSDEKIRDVEICARKIESILVEYGCRIVIEDYSTAWLEDKDNLQTSSLPKNT